MITVVDKLTNVLLQQLQTNMDPLSTPGQQYYHLYTAQWDSFFPGTTLRYSGSGAAVRSGFGQKTKPQYTNEEKTV